MMKVVFSAVAAAAFSLSGCSKLDTPAQLDAADTQDISYEIRNIQGNVDSVAPSTESTNSSVTLSFQLMCGSTLLDLSSYIQPATADTKATLYVTAPAKVQVSGIHCMAIHVEERTIELDGIYEPGEVDVVFLK